MIHGSLIILYSVISITGAIIFFCNHSKRIKRPELLSMLFFLGSHVLLFIFGVTQFVVSISFYLMLLTLILVLASRISNGIVLFGKNNWRHYFVTGGLILVIIILHLYEI